MLYGEFLKMTHRMEIKIEKLPTEAAGWMMRVVQERVFNSVVNFIAESFKIDRSKLTKEQKEDPVQVFALGGSKEECDKEMEKIHNLEKTKVQEVVTRFANMRILPSSVRRKLESYKVDTNNGSWQYLQKALFLFNILITIRVVEVSLQNSNNVKENN